MEKPFQASWKDALFISTIPFFLKGISLFLVCLQNTLLQKNPQQDLNPSDSYHFISWINNELISNNVYSNYLVFIGTMIALSLLIFLLKTVGSQSIQLPQVQQKHLDSHQEASLKRLQAGRIGLFGVGKLMIYYTLIFGIIQLISFISISDLFLKNDLANKSTSSQEKLLNIKLRSLEEQISSETEENVEKFLLSSARNAGKVLGSFQFEPKEANIMGFVISNDGKTVYVFDRSDIFLYDISDPKKANLIRVYTYLGYWLRAASMIVSPDDRFLYTRSQTRFNVIDVSNKRNLEICFTKELEIDLFNLQPLISLAISPDGKTLYLLTEKGLEFYDVSQPCSPKLIYHKDYQRRAFSHIKSSPRIASSKDSSLVVIASTSAFEIFNVTDPSNPVVLNSINLEDDGHIFSVTFSANENQLLLGVLDKDLNVSLQILDITNLNLPSLLSSLKLGKNSWIENLWFHPSKQFAFFYTRNEFRMISIEEMKQITLFSSLSDLKCRYFASSADGTRNLVYFSKKIITMKFNINVAPTSLCHFKPFAFQVIREINFDRELAIALSPDGKELFLLEESDQTLVYHTLESYNRSNHISLVKISEKDFKRTDNQVFWQGALWNLKAGKNNVAISYFPNINKVGTSTSSVIVRSDSANFVSLSGQTSSERSTIPSFAFPEHERWIAFITDLDGDGKNLTLKIMSLEELGSQISQIDLPFKNPSSLVSSMKINKNDTLLFYANCDLLIYNIMNPISPLLDVSKSLNISKTIGFTLSKNEQILYHFGVGLDGKRILQILDISGLSPVLAGSLTIEPYSQVTNSTELSPDGKILYLGFSNGMLMVDVQIPSQPVLWGFNYYLGQPHALAFVSNQKVFYAVSLAGVSAIDMTEQYVLDLKNSDLKIGGSYAIRPSILRLNKNLRFDFTTKEYKFLNFGVFGNKSASNAEPSAALPAWIDFDKEKSTLTIEPKLTASVYKISAILSIRIQPSAFIGLKSIPTENEANELFLTLFLYGYIDKQGYMTEILDLNQEIWINSQFSEIENDIRGVLAQSYIEAIGEFSVSSSLNISLETSGIKISTLSKGAVSVTIQLNKNEIGRNPSFVTKSYPNIKSTITNKNSLLLLDGPIDDVHEALKEVLVDFDRSKPSQARITVSDGLNPRTSRDISLSEYFIENKAPAYLGENSMEFSLENQLKNKQSFQTGVYSGIEFDKNTFKDENNLTLEYSLEMPDPKEHVPSWINLRGLNLIATPPEKYSTLSYDFLLVAKNEFRKVTVPFKLNVKISFSYGFRLVYTNLGYIFSLFGLIYTINKVYNLVARKYYRYPRSFKLKVGDQITDKTIFPLSFIKTEVNISKKLFDELEKHVAKNYEKVKGEYKNRLLDVLIDSESKILDQEKIISILETLENKDYSKADASSQKIIQCLIINKIVMKQLAKESETRKIFEKLKPQWMDFVISTSSSLSQFIINSEVLNAEISKISPPDQEGGDLLLLAKSKFNTDLLHNAILAHAFNFQNLDIDTIYVDVVSHKKLKGNSFYFMIKQFLQKDVKPFIFLNKREIGYGMKYVVEGNTLHFIGQLTRDLKDDIIVVHLKNNKGKILRELWLSDENETSQNRSSVQIVQELSFIQNAPEVL